MAFPDKKSVQNRWPPSCGLRPESNDAQQTFLTLIQTPGKSEKCMWKARAENQTINKATNRRQSSDKTIRRFFGSRPEWKNADLHHAGSAQTAMTSNKPVHGNKTSATAAATRTSNAATTKTATVRRRPLSGAGTGKKNRNNYSNSSSRSNGTSMV